MPIEQQGAVVRFPLKAPVNILHEHIDSVRAQRPDCVLDLGTVLDGLEHAQDQIERGVFCALVLRVQGWIAEDHVQGLEVATSVKRELFRC